MKLLEKRLATYKHLANVYHQRQNPKERDMLFMMDCLHAQNPMSDDQTQTAENECGENLKMAQKKGNKSFREFKDEIAKEAYREDEYNIYTGQGEPRKDTSDYNVYTGEYTR